jgi:hypothetical protein
MWWLESYLYDHTRRLWEVPEWEAEQTHQCSLCLKRLRAASAQDVATSRLQSVVHQAGPILGVEFQSILHYQLYMLEEEERKRVVGWGNRIVQTITLHEIIFKSKTFNLNFLGDPNKFTETRVRAVNESLRSGRSVLCAPFKCFVLKFSFCVFYFRFCTPALKQMKI